jgi:hypothetical protein
MPRTACAHWQQGNQKSFALLGQALVEQRHLVGKELDTSHVATLESFAASIWSELEFPASV